MKEVKGNLWAFPADVRVITTNGTVKKNGECVMGRGCAAEAKRKFASIAGALGKLLLTNGNHVNQLGTFDGVALYSFPVKHEWHQRADLELIKRSAHELAERCCAYAEDWYDRDPVIVLPRPGCGNGGLRWEDVKPVLAPILDDRFYIITFEYFNQNEV